MLIKTICEKQLETKESAEYFHDVMEMLRREQKEDKSDPEKKKRFYLSKKPFSRTEYRAYRMLWKPMMGYPTMRDPGCDDRYYVSINYEDGKITFRQKDESAINRTMWIFVSLFFLWLVISLLQIKEWPAYFLAAFTAAGNILGWYLLFGKKATTPYHTSEEYIDDVMGIVKGYFSENREE